METISKIMKAAHEDIGDHELALINKLTLVPLEKEQVFTFKVTACDSGEDDRNFEPLTAECISQLAKMYVGKPVIKNHDLRDVDGTLARVYAAEAVKENGLQSLVMHCYMPRTAKNEDLIAEINAGIKSEVSVDFRAGKTRCGICGASKLCSHIPGYKYDADGEKKTCLRYIEECAEVYELSFVTVGAQPRAGTRKSLDERKKRKLQLMLEIIKTEVENNDGI